ncbi:hypothetical protein V7x_55580 [Crateriforma conspicua]|uniref:Sulfotransferase family protein n=1 Tax=Crateriforma conspicua TaxID=2527996 RepID=A0A5C6FFP4_9PLAN|nr:sulfotransferase [Crateriforma conspicua]TWU59567.1 hypothetical protein V7x_55580 [Crateriforma conspicua]
MNPLGDRKVFCLGLSRTGTTAFASKLCSLGLRTVHYSLNAYLRINELAHNKYHVGSPRRGKYWEWAYLRECRSQDKQSLLEILEQYDAFADLPFPLLYRELAERYPNAYFVLTSRDDKSWLESMKWLLSDGHVLWKHGLLDDSLLDQSYGTHVYDSDRLLSAYQSHNQQVRDFFGNSNCFTELKLDQGDFSTAKLSEFLGVAPETGIGIARQNSRRFATPASRLAHYAASFAPFHFTSILYRKLAKQKGEIR